MHDGTSFPRSHQCLEEVVLRVITNLQRLLLLPASTRRPPRCGPSQELPGMLRECPLCTSPGRQCPTRSSTSCWGWHCVTRHHASSSHPQGTAVPCRWGHWCPEFSLFPAYGRVNCARGREPQSTAVSAPGFYGVCYNRSFHFILIHFILSVSRRASVK